VPRKFLESPLSCDFKHSVSRDNSTPDFPIELARAGGLFAWPTQRESRVCDRFGPSITPQALKNIRQVGPQAHADRVGPLEVLVPLDAVTPAKMTAGLIPKYQSSIPFSGLTFRKYYRATSGFQRWCAYLSAHGGVAIAA